MSKTWLVASYHFRQETGKRTFLLVLFSLPLFLAFTLGLGFLAASLAQADVTVGYVDQAGLLLEVPAGPEPQEVQWIPFETANAARAALEAGQIDAYYLLPPDYEESRHAELVYFEAPPGYATEQVEGAVRRGLLAGEPVAVADRLLAGASITVRATEANREFPEGGPRAGQFLPLVAAAIFVFLVLTTSGYMMEAIVVEKENRTMEVMVSSVSPVQLMAGKIAGALGMGMVQLAVWLAFLIGALWLGRAVLGIEWLLAVKPNWRDVAMIAVVALPSYLCLGALMSLVGSTLVDSQEAHQVGALFFIPLFLPLYLILVIAQNANGSLAVGLSLFPVTSVMTLAIRSLFVEVPVGQIAASVGIALACGLVVVWLAGRAFRISMLRYGQRLNLGDLFRRDRSPPAPIQAGRV
jgi:ABC-2 type transport system permease protein